MGVPGPWFLEPEGVFVPPDPVFSAREVSSGDPSSVPPGACVDAARKGESPGRERLRRRPGGPLWPGGLSATRSSGLGRVLGINGTQVQLLLEDSGSGKVLCFSQEGQKRATAMGRNAKGDHHCILCLI